MWKLDHKEGWALKNWCFRIAVLEKTLESTCKEIKPVNSKGNQPWISTGRTDADAEVESPILWPLDVKHQLIGKDPDAGKDWGQEEKGTTEDELVGWHHRLNGHESEQTPGHGEGQESLACCSPWGRKELDTTEWPNDWTTTAHKHTFTDTKTKEKSRRNNQANKNPYLDFQWKFNWM